MVLRVPIGKGMVTVVLSDHSGLDSVQFLQL
jgi:hypothetical protein